jgi:hypothetical protein
MLACLFLLFDWSAESTAIETIVKALGQRQDLPLTGQPLSDVIKTISGCVANKLTNTARKFAQIFERKYKIAPRPPPPRGKKQEDGPIGAAIAAWKASLPEELQDVSKVSLCVLMCMCLMCLHLRCADHCPGPCGPGRRVYYTDSMDVLYR